jgi:hypothetical protein
MDLIKEMKQKNERLLLQNALLQQHLCERVNAPQFRSFLTTFIVAPFVVGVAARFALGSNGAVFRHLFRAALPCLRFWPFF